MADREQQVGLHNLKPKPGARKSRKRLGRGEGVVSLIGARKSNGAERGTGEIGIGGSGSTRCSPPTPPDVRVRIRRFGS